MSETTALDRIADLFERMSVLQLYQTTDMDHHEIAKRLGIGTQRVNKLLKGLKKPKL